jgi:excisionase family DNA binding protein
MLKKNAVGPIRKLELTTLTGSVTLVGDETAVRIMVRQKVGEKRMVALTYVHPAQLIEITAFIHKTGLCQNKREKLFTSSGVAKLLQVDASSVVKWANDGLLNSYHTPGGHRRIRKSDLVTFIKKSGMFMPAELEAV